MKPNIKQISELTGFSPATISNALNNKPGVKKSTIDVVRQVAEDIGYTIEPKVTCVRFVIFKKNGHIIDDSPFFAAVIEGVERQAKLMGLETAFVTIDARHGGYQEQLRYIIDDSSHAVILLGTEMTDMHFQLLEQAKCHLLVLDSWCDNPQFDSVLINNTDAAAQATQYLIDKGHKKIGYLRGGMRIKAFSCRFIGFRRALSNQGIEFSQDYVFTVGTTLETAYREMREHLLKKRELPTAFFADNDVIALGAMRALQEQGVRVPEDVSIIGFDNLQYGEISVPRLTTSHVYKQEMGEIAVRTLMEGVKHVRKAKVKFQVCTDFVERDSVRDLNL